MADFDISIHALLAESDVIRNETYCATMISIHALLAESDAVLCRRVDLICEFLSTLSLRRATRGSRTDLS